MSSGKKRGATTFLTPSKPVSLASNKANTGRSRSTSSSSLTAPTSKERVQTSQIPTKI